jgi:hypothetical protein
MPRFIAFHPALFLILPESGFSGAGSYSQQRDTALLFPMSITPPECAIDPMDPRDQHATIGVSGCGRPVLLELG